MEHEISENVKEQSKMELAIKAEVETAATSTAHIDSDIDLNRLKQEPGFVQYVKSEPALLVKEEILMDSSQAGNEQQCVQGTTTPADTCRLNEDCGTSLRDLLNIKHEPDTMDVGPTVLQHMDIYYTVNKNMSACAGQNTIVDDCNKAMPCSGVKKEGLENKLRASLKSGQKIKEDDYNKEHLSLRLQTNLQQNPRNSRKNSMMTSSVEAATPSNQTRDEKNKTKLKPYVCYKVYSSKAAKFAKSPEATKQMRVLTSEKPYQCDACDARFARKDSLIRHLRIHTGEKPYQCDACDARFARKGYLTEHMRAHTGEKPYRCDRCDKQFSKRWDLTVHMRVHTGEKPYRCDTCDARFTRKGDLIAHMRVHTDDKPYQCDTCDARFARKGYLTMHKRAHTGEKPYWCDTCNKRFKERGVLIIHMRVHTGEKPYRCDMCDKRFKQRCQLTVHMRVHTGESPYRCDTCAARFKQRGAFTFHMRRAHTNEPRMIKEFFS